MLYAFKIKHFLLSLSLACFLIVSFSGVINFFVNNYFSDSESVEQILYPKRGWPAKNKSDLIIWQRLYSAVGLTISNKDKTIADNYESFYYSEFQKYHNSAEQNKIQPGYDENGIPLADLDKYALDFGNSSAMQTYMALTLRSYFIEYTINCINDAGTSNRPTIMADEDLLMWSMHWYRAGFFFQWEKIWIYELGRNVEKGFDLDFYKYGSYVKNDAQGYPQWKVKPDDAGFNDRKIVLKENLWQFADALFEKVF